MAIRGFGGGIVDELYTDNARTGVRTEYVRDSRNSIRPIGTASGLMRQGVLGGRQAVLPPPSVRPVSLSPLATPAAGIGPSPAAPRVVAPGVGVIPRVGTLDAQRMTGISASNRSAQARALAGIEARQAAQESARKADEQFKYAKDAPVRAAQIAAQSRVDVAGRGAEVRREALAQQREIELAKIDAALARTELTNDARMDLEIAQAQSRKDLAMLRGDRDAMLLAYEAEIEARKRKETTYALTGGNNFTAPVRAGETTATTFEGGIPAAPQMRAGGDSQPQGGADANANGVPDSEEAMFQDALAAEAEFKALENPTPAQRAAAARAQAFKASYMSKYKASIEG